MANKSFQFTTDTGTASNWFSNWWAWTRVAKQTGWRVKATYSGQNTTVNGAQAALPNSGTVTVTSTTGFSTAGMFKVTSAAGVLKGYNTYTGTGATTFTGCAGTGVGSLVTGDVVTEMYIDGYCHVNGTQSPTTTLTVFGQLLDTVPAAGSGTGTMGFGSDPKISSATGGAALHIAASGGLVTKFTYTGVTETTLTGCSGLPASVTGGDIIVSEGYPAAGLGTANYGYDGWAASVSAPSTTPTGDAYQTALSTKQAWIVLQGPDVIMIPIAAGAVPALVPREAVTQATSGATGELVSIVNDSTNPGWAIVRPRTGTFNATNVVTGATSGATFTPSASPKYFVEEVMIRKDTTVTTGQMFRICFDRANEPTSALSYLATLPSVALAVGPGCGNGVGGTGNTFPTMAQALCGTGGATTVGSTTNSFGLASGTIGIHCQIFGANAIPAAGVSPDGSCMLVVGSSNSALAVQPLGIVTVDNPQPGDPSLYVWSFPQSTALASYSRTVGTPNAAVPTTTTFGNNTTLMSFFGYTGRGKGTAGSGVDLTSYFRNMFPSTSTNIHGYLQNASGEVLRVRTHPSGTAPLTFETLAMENDVSGIACRKGNLRWMIMKSIGAIFSVSDTGTWMCFIQNAAQTTPSVWCGPHDNSYTPGP
jgi:hypothetical protein